MVSESMVLPIEASEVWRPGRSSALTVMVSLAPPVVRVTSVVAGVSAATAMLLMEALLKVGGSDVEVIGAGGEFGEGVSAGVAGNGGAGLLGGGIGKGDGGLGHDGSGGVLDGSAEACAKLREGGGSKTEGDKE